MIREFKMVGVLMAIVAMLALTASAAQAEFTSAGYPATVTGKSTKDVLDMFGSNGRCTEVIFAGGLSAGSNTLTMSPQYRNCTFFGLPATVNFTSCDYLFEETHLDIICSKAGDTIDVTVYSSSTHGTAICHITIAAQGSLTGISYANSGSNIVVSGSTSGISAKQNRTSFLCPTGTETSSATYTIQAGGFVLSGSNGAVSVS